MSEVKRYLADDAYPGQYSARCDLVPASAYDAAQSQLAALREELAEIKESTAYRGSLLGRTERRLGEAERRNKLLENILRNGRHLGGAGWKITVEAASHEDRN